MSPVCGIINMPFDLRPKGKVKKRNMDVKESTFVNVISDLPQNLCVKNIFPFSLGHYSYLKKYFFSCHALYAGQLLAPAEAFVRGFF